MARFEDLYTRRPEDYPRGDLRLGGPSPFQRTADTFDQRFHFGYPELPTTYRPPERYNYGQPVRLAELRPRGGTAGALGGAVGAALLGGGILSDELGLFQPSATAAQPPGDVNAFMRGAIGKYQSGEGLTADEIALSNTISGETPGVDQRLRKEFLDARSKWIMKIQRGVE